ncbi:DUF2089 family protein [Telmatocola sphagniphila]|uniref:DUF2089 family protein n=1 Tax=Telmatocola sphagniphila TaxID=1123043 RepID=A0A8E6F086_9BACT|nr:DUF2089 family protein [Telmatocola sphagniphila]QVL34538.1 DUF2089 family protein [Telmatocola sphagniphila]
MSFEKQNTLADHVLGTLPREDLDIIVELVLHSGSLKDLATAYGVTYPTIRLRLDRVIERLRAGIQGKKPDPIKELLAKLVERGELSSGGARALRDLLQKRNENSEKT